MKIRPHHLFCLFAYQGEGYSEGFKKQFSKMQRIYLEDLDEEVNIVVAPDDACYACPHLKDNACSSKKDGPEENVKQLDRKVLDLIGINPGFYRIRELHKKIAKLSLRQIESVCQPCQWISQMGCPNTICKFLRKYSLEDQQ